MAFFVGTLGARGAIVVDTETEYDTFEEANDVCQEARIIYKSWYVVVQW